MLDSKNNQFENIAWKVKQFSCDRYNTYYVYKNKDEYEEIKASSVSEAIEKSATTKPYKIIPGSCIYRKTIIQQELLVNNNSNAEEEEQERTGEDPAPQDAEEIKDKEE